MIRTAFCLTLFAAISPSLGSAQTLPGGGGGSGGSTTTVLLNEIGTGECIADENGDESCPSSAFDMADQLSDFEGEYGTSCNFGSTCDQKPPGSGYEENFVCKGQLGNTSVTLVENEVVILNSGSGTAVKKWAKADDGETGRGLELDDQISCFKVTECLCIQEGTDPRHFCQKGDIKIYALARYSLSNVQCIGTAQ
ncbi:MAG: hypothetical protein ACE361_22730 [Aureliella sp.]